MSEPKQGCIVAFSKEQGFGRVQVAGEGEIVFDAGVVACPLDGLIAGLEVLVDTYAGRVAGPRKVTRLWRADVALPAEPDAKADDRFEQIGPYRFLMPSFWPEGSVSQRGSIWSSVAKLNDVQCVLMVIVGGAKGARAKEGIVAARGAGARATTRCDVTPPAGTPFDGYRFDHGEEIELLYVLEAHGDVLTVGCRFAAGSPEPEKLVLVLLMMVGAAVIGRGPEAASSKGNGRGFWKRLLGG